METAKNPSKTERVKNLIKAEFGWTENTLANAEWTYNVKHQLAIVWLNNGEVVRMSTRGI